MRILQKNLLKSVSQFSNPSSLQLAKRDHIFKTAAAAVENKHTILLRCISWSGVDEGIILSEVSRQYFRHTKLCLPTSNSIDSPELLFFCGAATSYYTALSPHDLSPIETPDYFPHFNNYGFRGSCNGVICLDNYEEDALFWNPTTNHVKFLPKCEQGNRPDPKEIQPLNVITRFSAAGFGFDSESGDYKYIRWILFQFERFDDDWGIWHHEDTRSTVELYSLKKDSWEIMIHCPYSFMGAGREETACLNGHAYWISDTDSSNFTSCILCFNFSTQKFSTLPFPNSQKEISEQCRPGCSLFDYGGRLGLVLHPNMELKRSENDCWFEIWAWNGGGGEEGWWSNEFDGCIEGGATPLGFSEDGGVMFLVGVDRILRAFDIGTKKLKKLDIYCNPQRFDLIRFGESRVQLN